MENLNDLMGLILNIGPNDEDDDENLELEIISEDGMTEIFTSYEWESI